jgi:hypothetical protein
MEANVDGQQIVFEKDQVESLSRGALDGNRRAH